MDELKLKLKIRRLILLFISCLTLSGITAFPIESQLAFIDNKLSLPGDLQRWISTVFAAVKQTNENYPF